MADFRYQLVCDPNTGVCVTMDTATGAYQTDPRSGKVAVIFDPATRSIDPADAQTPLALDAAAALQEGARMEEVIPAVQQTLDYEALFGTGGGSTTTSGAGGGGGYDDGYGLSGGYAGGTSGYSRFSDYGEARQEPASRLPAYANGLQHPSASGLGLTPGGAFTTGEPSQRQQVTNPETGASAGPYGVSAPRSASSAQANYGGGVPFNHEGRRGSGQTSGPGGHEGYGANSALGQKARAKVWGMANKIRYGNDSAASSDSYSNYSHYHQPRPYRGPEDPRTARRVDKLNRKEAGKRSLFAQPSGAIPAGVNLESPYGDWLQNLPMTDLTLLAGAGKKNWAGGIDPTADIYDAYYKRLGKRLKKGKPGIDFLPFYKKNLKRDHGTEQFNRTLRSMYGGLVAGQRLDPLALMGNLTAPKKGTFLAEQFKKAPYSQAAEQFLQSYGAILAGSGYSQHQRNALAKIAQDLVTRYGQQYGTKIPKGKHSLNAYVGSRLTPFMQSSGGPY